MLKENHVQFLNLQMSSNTFRSNAKGKSAQSTSTKLTPLINQLLKQKHMHQIS